MSDEEDSVGLELGQEFPEPIVNEIREFEKPVWRMDKVELPQVEIKNGKVVVAPQLYDRVQARLQNEIDAVKSFSKITIPAEAQQSILYRESLSKSSSLQDLAWLKLRAYYRKMGQQQEKLDSVASQSMSIPEVDIELLRPENAHSEEAVSQSRMELNQPSTSAAPSFKASVGSAEDRSRAQATRSLVADFVPVKAYTQEYEQHLDLEKRWRQQRLLRSGGFVLSLCSVLTFTLIRILRRKGRKQKGGSGLRSRKD